MASAGDGVRRLVILLANHRSAIPTSDACFPIPNSLTPSFQTVKLGVVRDKRIEIGGQGHSVSGITSHRTPHTPASLFPSTKPKPDLNQILKVSIRIDPVQGSHANAFAPVGVDADLIGFDLRGQAARDNRKRTMKAQARRDQIQQR